MSQEQVPHEPAGHEHADHEGGPPEAGTRRHRRRPGPGALRLAAAVLAGGAMVWAATAVGATWGTDPGRGTDASATSTPVSADSFVRTASLGCPGWPADEDVRLTPVTRAATAPDVLGAPVDVGDGATLSASDDGPEVRFPAGGAPDEVDAEGWVLAAAGADAAPGLVAAQLVASSEQGLRGMAFTPCRAPAEVVHLVGGGSVAGGVEQVVVTNPGSDPVQVAVEVSGVDGPAEVRGGRGLVVPPGGRTAYLLDALAPGVESPVVTIRAEGGPVTAHMAEQEREGSVDLGLEVVPAAAEPARDLVLPALPGPGEQEGERSLTVRLFAPEGEAVVELRALTPDGARVPADPVVRVPAGATIDLDLDLDELGDDVFGLRLRSDAPMTAAAQLRLAPASDEPVVVEDDAVSTSGPGDDATSTGAPDEAATTVGPDGAATTAGPDDAASTTGPDGAASTAGPDDAASTARPDGAASTAGPDDAASTAGPDRASSTAAPEDGGPAGPRVVRPAGETAWVTAVALTGAPVGTALPAIDDLTPGLSSPSLSLAVSAVDATRAQVVWMDQSGAESTEDLDLANDTTEVLDVPEDAAAVWVRPTGSAGVVAALHLDGADTVGPYLGAATLPTVPWTRELTEVRPIVP